MRVRATGLSFFSRCVNGTIETASTISNTAVKAVRDMMVGVVEGVKDVTIAAAPKHR